MTRLRLADVELEYAVTGAGPPLICVHGGPGLGDRRTFQPFLDPLGDRMTLITYDLRGSGASSDPPDGSYELADHVADLECLRRHLGYPQVALFGESFGGMIALCYALVHGDRLGHLVLSNTTAHFQPERARLRALAARLPGVDTALVERLFGGREEDDAHLREDVGKVLPLYLPGATAELEAEVLAGFTCRHLAHNFTAASVLERYDLRDRLPEVAVPTLIACGRADWIAPVEDAEEIAAGIPGARLVVFENSGHMPLAEESERFLEIIEPFLMS